MNRLNDRRKMWMRQAVTSVAVIIYLVSSAVASNRIAIGVDSAGRVSVATITSANSLFEIQQITAGAGWLPWRRMSPQGEVTEVRLGHDSSQRLVFAQLATGGAVFWQYLDAEGLGQRLTELGTHDLRDIHLVQDADGRAEIIAVGGDNGVWSVAQTDLSDAQFKNVHSLGLSKVTIIEAAPYDDGRLGVIALEQGVPRLLHQKRANLGWDDTVTLDGHDLQSIGAHRSRTGALSILAIGGDGALYRSEFDGTSPHVTWSKLDGGHFKGPIRVGANADGRVEAVLIGANGAVLHIWESDVEPPWTKSAVPVVTSEAAYVDIDLAVYPDKSLIVAALRATGAVDLWRQAKQNSGWIPFASFDAPEGVQTPPTQPPWTTTDYAWNLPLVAGPAAYGATFPEAGLTLTGRSPDQWVILGLRNVSTVKLGILKPGKNSNDCGDGSATVPLLPTVSVSDADMKTLFGATQPHPPISVVVCAAVPQAFVTLGVRYKH